MKKKPARQSTQTENSEFESLKQKVEHLEILLAMFLGLLGNKQQNQHDKSENNVQIFTNKFDIFTKEETKYLCNLIKNTEIGSDIEKIKAEIRKQITFDEETSNRSSNDNRPETAPTPPSTQPPTPSERPSSALGGANTSGGDVNYLELYKKLIKFEVSYDDIKHICENGIYNSTEEDNVSKKNEPVSEDNEQDLTEDEIEEICSFINTEEDVMVLRIV